MHSPLYPLILVLVSYKVGLKHGPSFSRRRGRRRDSEHRENHHPGSSKERRTAAASGHQRHPSPRGRRGQSESYKSSPRSRPGGRLRALRRCYGVPHRAGRVAGRRAHGLWRRCWRPTPSGFRVLLLHWAGADVAGGKIAPPHPSAWKGVFSKVRTPDNTGLIHIPEPLGIATTCSPHSLGVGTTEAILAALGQCSTHDRECELRRIPLLCICVNRGSPYLDLCPTTL